MSGPSHAARRIAPWLALVGLAVLLFEAVFPRIETWMLSFGSPTPFYAYSGRDMLAFALGCARVAGLACMAGMMLVRADAEVAGRDQSWRAAAVQSLRRVPALIFVVVLRGAVVMLFAVPAALVLNTLTTVSVLALLVAIGLWIRLALVEPVTVLNPTGRPIAASWAHTGWRLAGKLLVAGLAWLPVLATFAIETASGQAWIAAVPTRAAGAEGVILALAPRLAWAPYTLFNQTMPPESAMDWALAGLRWGYLAGYTGILARSWRGFRRNAWPGST